MYARDEESVFEPLELAEEVTPRSVAVAVAEGAFARALALALRLGERRAIDAVLHAVPEMEMPLVARQLAARRLPALVAHVAETMAKTRHVEFFMLWEMHLLRANAAEIRLRKAEFAPALKNFQKNMAQAAKLFVETTEANYYTLDFLSSSLMGDTTDKAVSESAVSENAVSENDK